MYEKQQERQHWYCSVLCIICTVRARFECMPWRYLYDAVCLIVFFSAVFFSFAHTFAFSQSAKSVPLVPLILFLFNRNSIGGTYYFRDMCAYILHQTNINHTNSNTSTNINTIHGEPFVIFPRSVVVGTMPTISHPIPSMLFEHLWSVIDWAHSTHCLCDDDGKEEELENSNTKEKISKNNRKSLAVISNIKWIKRQYDDEVRIRDLDTQPFFLSVTLCVCECLWFIMWTDETILFFPSRSVSI